MKPPTDEELILYYYGEAESSGEIARALGESSSLAQRYEELRLVLDAIPDLVPPAIPSDDSVWRRLQPHLEGHPSEGRILWWPFDRRWALAAAAMLVVTLSFVAGRFSSSPAPESSAAAPGQRILLATLASHFERSEILLLELVNASSGSATDSGLDVTTERLLAKELSGANRLYRQAAHRAGERRVASVLDDLERLLIEVAHAPDELQADRLEELQLRLEEADILFKIRVVGSRLRQQTEPRGRSADADSGRNT